MNVNLACGEWPKVWQHLVVWPETTFAKWSGRLSAGGTEGAWMRTQKNPYEKLWNYMNFTNGVLWMQLSHAMLQAAASDQKPNKARQALRTCNFMQIHARSCKQNKIKPFVKHLLLSGYYLPGPESISTGVVSATSFAHLPISSRDFPAFAHLSTLRQPDAPCAGRPTSAPGPEVLNDVERCWTCASDCNMLHKSCTKLPSRIKSSIPSLRFCRKFCCNCLALMQVAVSYAESYPGPMRFLPNLFCVGFCVCVWKRCKGKPFQWQQPLWIENRQPHSTSAIPSLCAGFRNLSHIFIHVQRTSLVSHDGFNHLHLSFVIAFCDCWRVLKEWDSPNMEWKLWKSCLPWGYFTCLTQLKNTLHRCPRRSLAFSAAF